MRVLSWNACSVETPDMRFDTRAPDLVPRVGLQAWVAFGLIPWSGTVRERECVAVAT